MTVSYLITRNRILARDINYFGGRRCFLVLFSQCSLYMLSLIAGISVEEITTHNLHRQTSVTSHKLERALSMDKEEEVSCLIHSYCTLSVRIG